MSAEMAKEPAYKSTQEYKELLGRHKKLVDKGAIALLELTPVGKAFGGFGVIGLIKDKYGNVVLDTKNMEDRILIPPMGAVFRFDKAEDLKWIYAILNCQLYRSQCCIDGETPRRNEHRYILKDAEKASEEYAAQREESVIYLGRIYTLPEETCNLLCVIASLPTHGTLSVKRADLCRVWENDPQKRVAIKKMMDSPDIEYHEILEYALSKGNAQSQEGFYKTQNGVYKHNEQILGNSKENAIAYLKTNDEVFFALKKARNPTPEQKPLPSKPK